MQRFAKFIHITRNADWLYKDKTAKCTRKLHGMPEVSELSSEGLLTNNQGEVPLHALNERAV